MSRAVTAIEQEIQELSAPEQAQLLRTLLANLDGPPDPDVDAAWAAEVQRRSHEIDDGSVQCLPADEVFRKIDALIAK